VILYLHFVKLLVLKVFYKTAVITLLEINFRKKKSDILFFESAMVYIIYNIYLSSFNVYCLAANSTVTTGYALAF
jgi:hypothetical protein